MGKKKGKEKKTSSTQSEKVGSDKHGVDLFWEEKLSEWKKVVIVLIFLWLGAMIIFHSFVGGYITGERNHFYLAGDNVSAAAIERMGSGFQKEGSVPNWCPYIFGGMPMVGGLLYVNHLYWVFNPPVRSLLSFIFVGSDFGWLFIHFIIAGFGIYWLLRYFNVNWIIGLLFGILFAYNHTMVAFADVGHGSKVITIAYLPWLLYLTIRLFNKPNLLWLSLLAFFFGWQLRAHHIQVAYYGVMMMGLYMIFSFIVGRSEEFKKNLKATLYLTLSGIIGFAFAAPLILQILEYAPFIQRETGEIGSAAWGYATAWSFHPLESLTYIFPSFFGFGRDTYWGYMPFTDMPLYWGGLVLLFAPWAVILKRDKITWFLIILAVCAWMVSFGNFLPILYAPLYKLLPFFNKFRIPSLIQVLVLLSTTILAGRGFQAILEFVKIGGTEAENLGRKIGRTWMFIAGGCILLLIIQAVAKTSFISWMVAMQPRFQSGGAEAALGLIVNDALKLILLSGVAYGFIYLILLKKQSYLLLSVPIIFFLLIETRAFSDRLIRPYTTKETTEQHLQADDIVKFLQKDHSPFRFFPISGIHHPNWHVHHHTKSADGYAATKMRIYQTAKDSLGLSNPNLLRLMNVRYFISDRPVSHPDLEEVFKGQQEYVYKYKRALPRAFLVNQAVQVTSDTEALDLYKRGDFDFGAIAALHDPLSGKLDARAEGNVTWIARSPDSLALGVETSGRQLLFLSEMYYPSGWKATLDGEEIPILRCNFMFRGLEIPAGSHRVELTFLPDSYGKGILLSRIAKLLILIGLLIPFITWVRSRTITKALADGV